MATKFNDGIAAVAPPAEPNFRAKSHFLVLSSQTCWKCKMATPVTALALPPEHESRADLADQASPWRRANRLAVLAAVDVLSEPAIFRMCSGNPWYRFSESRSARFSYWFNHCAACGAKQSDLKMHDVPGNAFHPRDQAEAQRVTFVEIPEAIQGHARLWVHELPLFEHYRLFKA